MFLHTNAAFLANLNTTCFFLKTLLKAFNIVLFIFRNMLLRY